MNLNMQAFNINTLLGGLDKVRDVMGVYQQQLLLIVIVFALLNCFFGYALRKLWSVIPGFFLGAAAGYAAGTYTNQTTTITLALAVGTGLGQVRAVTAIVGNHCLRPLPDRTFSSDLRARRLLPLASR